MRKRAGYPIDLDFQMAACRRLRPHLNLKAPIGPS